MHEVRRPIKVMMLSASLGKGGTERVFSVLLEHFDRSRFAPELALFDYPIAYAVPDDVRIHVLSKRPAARSVLSIPVSVDLERDQADALAQMAVSTAKLAELVDERRPDVVVASPLWAGIMALCSLDRFPSSTRLVSIVGAPPSVWLAGNPQGELFSYLIGERLENSNEIVAVSRGVADDLSSRFRIDHSRIRVVHTPVDVSGIERLSRETPDTSAFDDDVPVIAFVGRLERVKGAEYLIRAVARVVTTMPVRCVLVGDGSQRGYLVALAKHLGIAQHVEFVGQQANPFAYVGRADVFVLPSLSEGLPNALLEAMACGCPAIATDIEGGVTREVFQDGLSGVIVPVGDVSALGEAIEGLLGDPERRRELAEAGRLRAADFDLPCAVHEFENLVAEVAAADVRTGLRADGGRSQSGMKRPLDARDSGKAATPSKKTRDNIDSSRSHWGSVRGLLRRIRAKTRRALAGVSRALKTSGQQVAEDAARYDFMVRGDRGLILLVTSGSADGSTESLVTLGRHMMRSGYGLVVADVYGSPSQADAGAEWISLAAFPDDVTIDADAVLAGRAVGEARDLEWLAAMAGRLAHLVSAFGVDAVLASGYEAGRIALIAKRFAIPETPVFVSMPDGVSGIGAGPHGKLDTALLAEYLGSADGVFVRSEVSVGAVEAAADNLQGLVAVVPEVVDVQAIISRGSGESADRPLSVEGAPVFIWAVAGSTEADVGWVFDALGAARSQAALRVLVIAEDSSLRHMREQSLERNLGEDSIEFASEAAWSNRLLEGSIGLIIDPVGEGQSLPAPIVRAIAAGCPVVSTEGHAAVDGLLESGRSATIVRRGDVEAMSESLLQLLWDDSARSGLAQCAASRLEGVSASVVVGVLEEKIGLAIKSRREPGGA